MSKVSVTKTKKPSVHGVGGEPDAEKVYLSLPWNLATHWLCLMTMGKTLAVVAGVYQDQDLLEFFFIQVHILKMLIKSKTVTREKMAASKFYSDKQTSELTVN